MVSVREVGARVHDPRSSALPSVSALRSALPRGSGSAQLVDSTRAAIRDLLHGRDRERWLVIVGPCSMHSREGALAYAERLRRLARRTSDRLLLVMRTYFEKPRTSTGWKGWIHDPHLDGSAAVADGIRLARECLREINALGVPCASELLDPLVTPYLDDLLSWAAIGARTSESQVHRELASGLCLPVGFKNSTSGDLDAALNGMIAARSAQSALGVSPIGVPCAYRTAGNPDVHLVLRGGRSGPNYFAEPLQAAIKRGRDQGLERPVMVDCSHANSGFDPLRQASVAQEIARERGRLADGLLGIQLESHVEPGRQAWTVGCTPSPFCSVTDACMGWEETESLLEQLACALASR